MSDHKNYKISWTKIKTMDGGGQGYLFLVVNEKKQIAVVKKLKQQNDMERRSRMRREVVNLETLEHKGLPKVIESNTAKFRDPDYELYIVLEYIEGATLQALDLSNTSFEAKIDFMLALNDIVNHSHSRGVIHRDIKPDNIIVRNNDISMPVLIDFGLSFNSDEQDDDFKTPDGQHLGNRFLILPEQKVGESGKRDERSDVVCLAGIFYYLLTDHPPVNLSDEHNHKPHQRSVAKEIINALPKHQKTLVNDLFDTAFNQIISNRFQSVTALSNQLELIKNASLEKELSIEEMIAKIKNQSNNPNYQHEKTMVILLDKVKSAASKSLQELCVELGEDFIFDYSMVAYAPWGGTFILKNEYSKLTLSVNFNTFVTGSEVVCRMKVVKNYNKEQGIEKEIFRATISKTVDLESMKMLLKKICIEKLNSDD